MEIKDIVKKLKHSDHRRKQYSGYLTSVEIVQLCDGGARPNYEPNLERAKKDKENGISSPSWFYCSLNKELTEMFKNVHHEKKRTKPHFRRR